MTDAKCTLCASGMSQTNKHVISNCSAPIALQRYTKRHDDVLRLVCNWLKSVLASSQELFVDLQNFDAKNTCDIFNNFRPDIAIVDSSSIKTLELTVCHETNLQASEQYKQGKYTALSKAGSTLAQDKVISNYTLEVSTLGFISSIYEFLSANKLPKLPATLKHDVIHSVLNNTFIIYCNRNSPDVF